MPSPLIAAIGTAFASGGVGATILGGIVSGIGTGLMEKSRYKAEEKAAKAKDDREEARYDGAGDSENFFDINTSGGVDGDQTTSGDLTTQRVRGQKNAATPLGQTDTPLKIGSQFSSPTTPKPPTQSYKYDPDAGRVVYG